MFLFLAVLCFLGAGFCVFNAITSATKGEEDDAGFHFKKPADKKDKAPSHDALHPLVEEAAREYYAKWPARDTAQRLAFQDAVLAAVEGAWRRGASNGELEQQGGAEGAA